LRELLIFFATRVVKERAFVPLRETVARLLLESVVARADKTDVRGSLRFTTVAVRAWVWETLLSDFARETAVPSRTAAFATPTQTSRFARKTRTLFISDEKSSKFANSRASE
jgi:hypothetical protein